jgi:hypothetical protein
VKSLRAIAETTRVVWARGRNSHQRDATVTVRPTASDRINHDERLKMISRAAAASDPWGTAAAMAPVTVPLSDRTGS